MIVVLLDAAGWIGAAALLSAYALVSTGRLPGQSMAFQALNLIGAAGLLANSAFHGAWPSSALNLVWLFLGFHAAARILMSNAVDRRTSRAARSATARAEPSV